MAGLRAGIIVVSDAVHRGERDDVSGRLAGEILEKNGFAVTYRRVVPNSYRYIHDAVLGAVEEADFVLVIGGTGPSPRDISVDVVESLSWRRLPGFGELFRLLSYQEAGAKAMFTRAELFLVGRTPVAVTPGSPGAVRLALEKLLVPAIPHVVEEARRIEGVHREPGHGR